MKWFFRSLGLMAMVMLTGLSINDIIFHAWGWFVGDVFFLAAATYLFYSSFDECETKDCK